MTTDTDHLALIGEWINAHWPQLALLMGMMWGLLVWVKQQIFRDYATVVQMNGCKDAIILTIKESNTEHRKEHKRMMERLDRHIDG